jgi:5-methylcytosine-specific restriction endonuclease McrA
MIERQNFRCAVSGRVLTPETASLDHIVPLARGGEHGTSNIWVVDQQINSAKGTMTIQEFKAMCHDVVNHEKSDIAAPA